VLRDAQAIFLPKAMKTGVNAALDQ